MAFASSTTYFDTGDGSILGGFFEKEHGRYFEFSSNPQTSLHPPAHGGKNVKYPHLVWVGTNNDPEPRVALVKGTVAHVVVDETVNGYIIEKWDIRAKKFYDTTS